MERSRGSITVFMALILSLLVAVTCTSLESVRMAAARTQILNGMDVGLYSLFAGYDRELLEKYDLFFLDSGYGGSTPEMVKVYDTFRSYMEPVLKQNYQKLAWQNGGIAGYTMATDGNGTLFYEQAVRYMKKTLGVSGLQLLLNNTEKEGRRSREAEDLWQSAGENRSMNAYEQEMTHAAQESHEASKESGGGEEALPEGEFGDGSVGGGVAPAVENPIPVIMKIQRMGLLGLVLPYGQSISGKSLDSRELVSARSLYQGMGTEGEGLSADLESKALFHEYILKKLGNFRNPASAGRLSYEAEYVLMGKTTDEKNLKAVAGRLLLIREGLNLGFLMSDGRKRAEAGALAGAIASAFLIPPAAGIIEMALLLCWSFAESLLDLRSLFAGDRIPVMKTEGNWQLSLANLPELLSRMDTDRKSAWDGLDYEGYLRVLFLLEEEKVLCMRCMDMVESGIREEGRPSFRLDSCIGEAEMWVSVSANGRKIYSVTRSYAYE